MTTIHDLIYRIFPDAHLGLRHLGMRVLVPLAVRRSHRLIAISANTRDDLARYLKVEPSRIDVVPQGVGPPPNLEAVPEPEIRSRYELGERRVALSVSAKRPHKNLPRLLEALAQLTPTERPILILPGYRTSHEGELRQVAGRLGVERDVRYPGWVDTAELEALYRLAECFVFPSLYEGFGLPVLEAMQRGLPVACSNTSSLPEVAGDAALFFDPVNSAEIAGAIRRLLTDGDEAARLRRLGPLQARRFSWEKTARLTLESYERALEGQRRGHPETRRR